MHIIVERAITVIALLIMTGALVWAKICQTRATAKNDALGPLMGHISEGYLGLDTEGRIVQVNDAYLKMTGYRKSSLLGTSIESLVISDTLGPYLPLMKNRIPHKTAIYRARHRKADGTLVPLEVAVTALPVGEVAYVCLYRDLTAIEEAEQRARHTLGLLEYVVEHARSAVVVFDTQMRYLLASTKYLAEYGLKEADDIIGKTHYEVIPYIPERWREIHSRALSGEVLSAEDDYYEMPDGRREYTRWECRPWYDANDKIGGMVLYTENITAQKQLENELREARDYLSTLISRANAPIVVWDETQTIVRANLSFASLFGLGVGHLIGQHLSILHPYLDPDELKQVLPSTQKNKRIESLEVSIKLDGTTVKTILWTITPVYEHESGNLLATIAQGQEITERKHLEAELQEQLEELRRWYAVMAHREDRIIELKQEVNDLLEEHGKDVRYSSFFEGER
ncbi:MAG: PAS domain S-box protein [Sphaerochaeta sp.]